ncbi:vesicle-associated membrane protein 8 isoform X6 [Chiloscyllium plagiosum]|uniref:vesicle-associated membrane protein 8 isoform X6 n=1 Tax=Chiloscyllium plagiosum TaxID=36176 RepID=UPI001CB83843|nr:vesicle-associated membrane protein 8 isoform X6 [Chiloscyllium plagiosum]
MFDSLQYKFRFFTSGKNASCSMDPGPEKLSHIQGQVNDVKGIMSQNIEKVLERGEKLDDLIIKTDDLQASADTFQKTSTKIARKMWWKNTKMIIIIVDVGRDHTKRQHSRARASRTLSALSGPVRIVWSG